MDIDINQVGEREELVRLQNEINRHNYRYHVLDDPIISDYEYDMLVKRLYELEAKHPDLVSSDSPTQRSGAKPLEKFNKVIHPAPILSLANVFDLIDLKVWYERVRKLNAHVEKSKFVLEPKIDGLTVVLSYENGIFVRGATRGDGEIGEEITENLKTIRSIPLRIPVEVTTDQPPSSISVRGEVFILKKDFQELNRRLEEKDEKVYQNPRNTAAGSLRQLDPGITHARPLNLLTYSIVECSGKIPDSQWETLEYLRKLGFPVSSLSELVESFSEVANKVSAWMNRRDDIPFEVDGVVIKLDDLRLVEELGFVGKDPRGSVAYKYPAREVTTSLLNIGVNVGRTGVLTPFAILEPVQIGGVVVRQATLHNFDFIAEKDIRINDRVLIKRAGDVIPYVIGPIVDIREGSEKNFKIPTVCPSCGQEVEHIEGEVAYYCVNASCPAQLVRNLDHFVSKEAMNIEGMGIKIVEQLVEYKILHDISDLFILTTEQLEKVEGFAEKKAENLIRAIERSKANPLSKLIIGLGIRGVGEIAAKDLARRFVDLQQLASASTEELKEIHGIGETIAISIMNWFTREANRELMIRLKRYGVWPVEKNSPIVGLPTPLMRKTFVITGTLSGLTRDEAKILIERAGGKVTNSISAKTDYLVVGENPGSKLGSAKKYAVAIIYKEDLLKMTTSS